MKDESEKKPLTRSDCRKLAAVLIATWFFLAVIVVIPIKQCADYWPGMIISVAINMAIGLFFERLYDEVLNVNGVLIEEPVASASEVHAPLRVRAMREREAA